MYPCCVWRAPVIHVFAFIFPILPCNLCRGPAGHVERTRVVIIMPDSWGHWPDPCRLWHAGNLGPGRRVTSRSRIWSHCSQVVGQVLRSWVLQGCLHHVLGEMLLDLGSSFSSVLQRQRLGFSDKTIGGNLDISMFPCACLAFPLRSKTGLWIDLHVKTTFSMSKPLTLCHNLTGTVDRTSRECLELSRNTNVHNCWELLGGCAMDGWKVLRVQVSSQCRCSSVPSLVSSCGFETRSLPLEKKKKKTQ